MNIANVIFLAFSNKFKSIIKHITSVKDMFTARIEGTLKYIAYLS